MVYIGLASCKGFSPEAGSGAQGGVRVNGALPESPPCVCAAPAGARGGQLPGRRVGESFGDATDAAGPWVGEIQMGGRVWNWVWAAWRTGGRLFGRRLQGGHPCLAGWRLRRRRG